MRTWMFLTAILDMWLQTHNTQSICYIHGWTQLQVRGAWLTRGTLTCCDRHSMSDRQSFWHTSVMRRLNCLHELVAEQ